jgi:hypothetical protein
MTTISKEQLIQGYADWFSQFAWDWFATLTFRGYPSRKSAQEKFEWWIAQLRRKGGGRNFRFVQVAERGASGNNVHFHLLIGGLKRNSYPGTWERKWNELAGEAEISGYKLEELGVYRTPIRNSILS